MYEDILKPNKHCKHCKQSWSNEIVIEYIFPRTFSVRFFFGEKFSEGFFPWDFCHFHLVYCGYRPKFSRNYRYLFLCWSTFFNNLQPSDYLGSLSKESVQNSLISQMRHCLPLPWARYYWLEECINSNQQMFKTCFSLRIMNTKTSW